MSSKPTSNEIDSADAPMKSVRVDTGAATSSDVWLALSQTPGIGVSITDAEGRLLFVNSTTAALFSGDSAIDYQGK